VNKSGGGPFGCKIPSVTRYQPGKQSKLREEFSREAGVDRLQGDKRELRKNY